MTQTHPDFEAREARSLPTDPADYPDMRLADLMSMAHATAVEHGWWEGAGREIGTQIALMHSELSEALEHWRVDGLDRPLFHERVWKEVGSTYGLGPDHFHNELTCGPECYNMKPDGFVVELADTIIRILDTAQNYQLPLLQALAEKMAFNDTRPYRHGNKIA